MAASGVLMDNPKTSRVPVASPIVTLKKREYFLSLEYVYIEKILNLKKYTPQRVHCSHSVSLVLSARAPDCKH